MRKSRLTILVVASLVALIALPARSLAAPSPDGTLLGFTDDLPRITRAAPAVQGISQVARIPIYWTGARATGWVEVDAAVDAARTSGQRVLFTVTGTEAPNLAEWASFLTSLHARYPDMWALQAWNEPNLSHIGGNLSLDQTAGVVMAARAALPGVRVIGPAVSPKVPGASEYQTLLYRALPDEIGVGVNLFTYRAKAGVATVVDQYRQAEADGAGAEVYVTEIGFHGAYFPDQATPSAQAFGALRREGAATVIFYRLLTNPALTVEWELGGRFNVLNDDLSPTPTFTALRSALDDTTAPKVDLKKATVQRKKRKVKIAFSFADDVSGRAQLSFTCRLDKQKPKPCRSPVTYKRLKFGKHTLVVTAMDSAGNEATDTKKFRLRRP